LDAVHGEDRCELDLGSPSDRAESEADVDLDGIQELGSGDTGMPV